MQETTRRRNQRKRDKERRGGETERDVRDSQREQVSIERKAERSNLLIPVSCEGEGGGRRSRTEKRGTEMLGMKREREKG